MTSNHDQDAFELRFESAVNSAHDRAHRGSAPSGRVWESIRGQMGNELRADTADPHAIGPALGVDTSITERNRDMDSTLSSLPRRLDWSLPRKFGWTAVTAGLIGLLVITSIFLNGGGSPPAGRNDLAWAPGLGTPETSVGIASPAATPPTYTYGPEYACEVEPLTPDEVLDTVLNPERGYVRLGSPDHGDTEGYYEFRGTRTVLDSSFRDQTQPAGDADLALEASAAADEFWNCLMTGTAYQVWAMTDPALVQSEVLLNLPVVRTEEDIVRFIEEWGPRRYSAGLGLIWSDLGNLDPIMIAKQSSARASDVRLGSTSLSGSGIDLALVPLFPMPESGQSTLNYAEVGLQKHPNGQWIVIGMNFPNAGG